MIISGRRTRRWRIVWSGRRWHLSAPHAPLVRPLSTCGLWSTEGSGDNHERILRCSHWRARRASARARAGRETRRRATTAAARVARATFERLRRNVGRGQGRIGRATGARQRGVGTTRPGSGGCCRMASAFPNPADAWATTWARILDLCADVNGAPLVRTPPRRSWGRGPSPLGVAANTGPLVDVSFTASCAAPTGRVPGLRGAFIIASTPCSCVGVGDQHSGIVRLFEVV